MSVNVYLNIWSIFNTYFKLNSWTGQVGASNLEEEIPPRRASQPPIQALYLLQHLLSTTSSTVLEHKVYPHATWSPSLAHTLLDKLDASLLETVSTTKATTSNFLSPCLDKGAVRLTLALATTMKPLLISTLLEGLTSTTTDSFSTTGVYSLRTKFFTAAVQLTRLSCLIVVVWTPFTAILWGLWLRWAISNHSLDPMVRSVTTVADPIESLTCFVLYYFYVFSTSPV